MDLLLATIAAAGSIVLLFLFLRRTRGSVLLSRKAKVLNWYYDALEEAGYHDAVFSLHDAKRIRRISWKV
ncbi:hypothetical protein CDV55_102416 [Aspergillus turcosus]|uniref:Uncharacterized protein n=1 Tax=Aspergillus turcosus TaxID=1245748 RepID=A0A229XF37_9EURO|nr:hypothetical protein CDV55_102416 [Aspergillus turcosus]RLL94762.1 hypothetical protein CFD26_103609 [Aspergillus turcosus]